jgi:hypothetical protein
VADSEPEPGVAPTAVPVVPVPAPEGSDSTEDAGLVEAGARPLLVVVALESQADVVTGGLVVSGGEVIVLWQTGGIASALAEAPAVCVLEPAVAPADG